MDDNIKIKYGGFNVRLSVRPYANGNICVAMEVIEPDGTSVPFSDLTVNRADGLRPFDGYIDTKKFPGIHDFLSRNGLGTCTGKQKNGCEEFPLFRFDRTALARYCPEGTADYAMRAELQRGRSLKRHFRLSRRPYADVYGDIITVNAAYQRNVGYCAEAQVVEHQLVNGSLMVSKCYAAAGEPSTYKEMVMPAGRRSSRNQAEADRLVFAGARKYADALVARLRQAGQDVSIVAEVVYDF